MKRVCYTETGMGDIVLLLHSSLSSKSQFKDLSARLSSSHHVIAIDLLGYGAAPFPEDTQGFGLKNELAHINQVLADLKVDVDKPFHLVGHSYGGATALRWAYDNPHQVKSLHLFEPVAFHLLEKTSVGLAQITDVVDGLYAELEKGNKRALCQAFIDYWSGKGAFNGFPPHIQDAMTGQVDKVVLDFEALLHEPLNLEDYRGFSFPISLIMGMRSPVSSRSIAMALRDNLRGLEFYQVDCGHMGPVTHPRQVNEIWQKEILKNSL